MLELVYRLATAAELVYAAELRARMDLELNGADPDADGRQWRDRFAEFFASRMRAGQAQLTVTLAGDAIVAMGAVYLLANHRSEIWQAQSAYVTSVFVEPAFRHRGIATELTRRAVEWAKGKGCVVVRLRTSSMGRAVYERLGFERTDELEFDLV